jgi:hypothetical protein
MISSLNKVQISAIYTGFRPVQNYLADRVALVVVKASLHAHDRNPIQQTKHQLARMTFHGRDWEMWNLLIWEAFFVCQSFCQ